MIGKLNPTGVMPKTHYKTEFCCGFIGKANGSNVFLMGNTFFDGLFGFLYFFSARILKRSQNSGFVFGQNMDTSGHILPNHFRVH